MSAPPHDGDVRAARPAAALLTPEDLAGLPAPADDRPGASSGRFVPSRWSTPVDEHRDVRSLHVIHHGSAVYARPEGPFTCGTFTLRSIHYDAAGPSPDRRPIRREAG